MDIVIPKEYETVRLGEDSGDASFVFSDKLYVREGTRYRIKDFKSQILYISLDGELEILGEKEYELGSILTNTAQEGDYLFFNPLPTAQEYSSELPEAIEGQILIHDGDSFVPQFPFSAGYLRVTNSNQASDDYDVHIILSGQMTLYTPTRQRILVVKNRRGVSIAVTYDDEIIAELDSLESRLFIWNGDEWVESFQ